MIPRAAWYLVTKTERAKLHLDALNDCISGHMKEPYTVIRRFDEKSRRHIKRIQMKGFDSTLAMELGEFLYCLRSGLDQMAWQMATVDARRNCPTEIYFPIPEDLSTRDRRRNYARILKLFPHDVAREIDAIQPHNGANPAEDHPLWQLNKLCNLDKHLRIPIHSTGFNVFCPEVPGVQMVNLDNEDALEISVPEEHGSYLDLKPTVPEPIEIGEWDSDWRIPAHRLNDIHAFVVCTVIPKFMPFNLAALFTQPLRIYNKTAVY